MPELVTIETVHGALLAMRGRSVILDSDLASYFEVETRVLNQAVKRNEDRFEGYAFQLNAREIKRLKSQGVMASEGRGGRRTPPWVFTEHGVVMAATVLNSDRAIKASRRIIEAFVRLKQNSAAKSDEAAGKSQNAKALVPTKAGGKAVEQAATTVLAPLKSEFLPRLREQFEALLEAEINPRQRKTVREETEEFISEGINHFKARLKSKGLENEEIQARVLKYVAEAEVARAKASTERQMTERQRLKNQANQLRLMIRAEIALTSGEMSDLLEVLDELGTD